MPDVIIIGDGPGGLGAALFLAKKNKDVLVFGTDQTPMHKAMLLNYLGISKMTGSEFQRVARQQVADLGAKFQEASVTSTSREGDVFTVTTVDNQKFQAKYVIFAAGVNARMAEGVGLTLNDRKMIEADRNGRTAVENAYAIGWSTRPDKIQAIISAGDGAAAALDILSKEAGKDIHDFDLV
jgi:thioredoxin reductase